MNSSFVAAANNATAPTTECPSSNTYYEYGIYAALGVLLVASEALGLTKSIKPNSIIDVVLKILQGIIAKRAAKQKTTTSTETNTAV